MGRQRHCRSQRSGPGNRFQAGRRPTWAGTGNSCFSVGRRAKDAEPVSLGGSMSAKVLYLQPFELFSKKPLDIGARGKYSRSW